MVKVVFFYSLDAKGYSHMYVWFTLYDNNKYYLSLSWENVASPCEPWGAGGGGASADCGAGTDDPAAYEYEVPMWRHTYQVTGSKTDA